MAGYLTGAGSLAANIGCETAAAIGFGVVAAGPIVGGIIGYCIYRGVRRAVRG